MLIPFADVLKPYQNRKLQHRGLVVENEDPKKLGRIKVKVQGVLEAEDHDRLPWCFPKEPTTRGGRPDSCVTAVPPLYSMVLIEFPESGDSPVGGGSPYYPVWIGMNRNEQTTPSIATGTGVVEDSGLTEPYGTGENLAEQIEVDVWVKHQSQNVAWVRINKERGDIELFDQDSGALIRLDRGGNLMVSVTSLTVAVKEDVRFKVGGNTHFETEGETFIESGGDIGIKSGGNVATTAANNIDDQAGNSIGMQAVNTVGLIAGTSVGLTAGESVSIASVIDTTINSAGAIDLVAIGTISEIAALIARDAFMLADNEGLAVGPLSEPPPPLTTNATVMEELAESADRLNQRADALAAQVQELLAEAAEVKAKGQEIAAMVEALAAELNGSDI